MIPLHFVEVRVTSVADEPLLLLREVDGPRVLPIWTTAAGANAILSALEGAADDGHPGTHDLLLDALAALDAVVEEVRITDVDEGIWTAEVVVNRMTIAARVSDAVALALRSGAPILASAEVLDAAGVGGAVAAGATDLVFGADVQMERFRAFLDTISPDDFAPEDPTDPGGPG